MMGCIITCSRNKLSVKKTNNYNITIFKTQAIMGCFDQLTRFQTYCHAYIFPSTGKWLDGHRQEGKAVLREMFHMQIVCMESYSDARRTNSCIILRFCHHSLQELPIFCFWHKIPTTETTMAKTRYSMYQLHQ